ncbi:MAG: bifunctional hydroxymethylpyrimidine kinase/phosphomethylpyrimidine kinase [Deltaproteobacteria bacterium CG11_big_fil_rev_8_21_14_0_20_49_13]|nr:MAG: bifunctional hydroxymethylpyrimidine kinase/phosphomethylpyrimidine kinase [Deltaproteobacteria bacterium CG11_big_fil_rev_8_21_14_0_20_49_13]
MQAVLTIAGSDPSGGAGIQADLRTIELFGAKGLSAITAITAQTDKMAYGINPVSADILTQQLSAAARDSDVSAIKIGMIGSAANVRAIMLFLHSVKVPHIVIDPVLASTSGMPLLEAHAFKAFKEELLPNATVITPNIDEAGVLTGMRLWNVGIMKEAAQQIYAECWQLRRDKTKTLAVLVKGGHSTGDPTDVLFDGKKFTEFKGKRMEGPAKHGTGCRLSSAIASGLANGKTLEKAISEAKKFIENFISEKGENQ